MSPNKNSSDNSTITVIIYHIIINSDYQILFCYFKTKQLLLLYILFK